MKSIILIPSFLVLILASCSDEKISKQDLASGDPKKQIVSKAPSYTNARPSFPIATAPYPGRDLYIGVSVGLAAVSASDGSGFYYSPGTQPDNIAMASTGNEVYTVLNGRYGVTGPAGSLPTLYRLDLTTGNYVSLTSTYLTTWTNTDALAAWGGWLYAIQGGTLWRIETSLGFRTQFSQYPQGWQGTEGMTALNNFLYAIQGGTLWRVNISTGAVSSFSQFPTGWAGTEAMAATNGGIFVIQGGTLWRVGANNGSVVPFSAYPNGWGGTLAMTARNGILYVVQGGVLWTVNTFNGAVGNLGNADWTTTTAMTARVP